MNVNLQNYQIEYPGPFPVLTTNGKAYDLLLFRYLHNDVYNEEDNYCLAPDRDKYMIITCIQYKSMLYSDDVFIKIENHKSKKEIYEVIVWDSYGKFTSSMYRLNKDEIGGAERPNCPFKLKYYDLDTKRIYILDKGYYLEVVHF